MKNIEETVSRQFVYAGMTMAVFIAMNWLNELVFARMEYGQGISWVFLPAGIRLLATLLFGFSGFVGLFFAGVYLNFHHFGFDSDFRALSGALAGAGGPYLAYLFAKQRFRLGKRLANLTARRLLMTGVLCGVMSPSFHHAFMWMRAGEVDWPGLMAMITGDIVGILIVLYLAKGLIAWASPRPTPDHRS